MPLETYGTQLFCMARQVVPQIMDIPQTEPDNPDSMGEVVVVAHCSRRQVEPQLYCMVGQEADEEY